MRLPRSYSLSLSLSLFQSSVFNANWYALELWLKTVIETIFTYVGQFINQIALILNELRVDVQTLSMCYTRIYSLTVFLIELQIISNTDRDTCANTKPKIACNRSLLCATATATVSCTFLILHCARSRFRSLCIVNMSIVKCEKRRTMGTIKIQLGRKLNETDLLIRIEPQILSFWQTNEAFVDCVKLLLLNCQTECTYVCALRVCVCMSLCAASWISMLSNMRLNLNSHQCGTHEMA